MYLLKRKDEVFDKFKEFKVEVKNLRGKKIKTLRCNVPQIHHKKKKNL
jgi:hypothetical protein